MSRVTSPPIRGLWALGFPGTTLAFTWFEISQTGREFFPETASNCVVRGVPMILSKQGVWSLAVAGVLAASSLGAAPLNFDTATISSYCEREIAGRPIPPNTQLLSYFVFTERKEIILCSRTLTGIGQSENVHPAALALDIIAPPRPATGRIVGFTLAGGLEGNGGPGFPPGIGGTEGNGKARQRGGSEGNGIQLPPETSSPSNSAY